MEENTKKIDEQSEVNVDLLVIQQAELQKIVINLRKEYEKKKEELHELNDKIAVLKCEFKVGDKITYDGKTFILGKIKAGYNNIEQELYVHRIKNNGYPYEKMARLYVWGRDKVKLAV